MTGCPLLDSEYAARQNGKRLPCERLQAENVKLRELCRRLARALGIWSDWCNRECGAEFACDWTVEGCTAAEMLRELRIEVDG